MNHADNILALFNLLHDGCIKNIRPLRSKVELKIEIQYLSEILEDKDNYIILQIDDLKSISLQPWSENAKLISDINEIAKLGLEIINCELADQGHIVHCNFVTTSNQTEGGQLYLEFSSFRLFKDNITEITLTELKEVAEKYWNQYD